MKLLFVLVGVILVGGVLAAGSHGQMQGMHGQMQRMMQGMHTCPMCGNMRGGRIAAAGSAGHGHGDEAVKIGEPAAAENATRTAEIILRDNYYEPESIAVKKGEIVRFAIKNEGRLVHEFNIGTAEMHAAHKDEMLMMLRHGVLFPDRIDRKKMEADGEDGHSMKHDDPNSVLLAPGEEGEIVWKFSETAELEFACNIPGHYESGMVGEIKWQ